MTTWVLLRGLMRDSRHWYGFDQYVSQQKLNIITVDLPGNGVLVDQISPMLMKQYCAAVWRQIDAALLKGSAPASQGKVVLVGLSMGGMLALTMAKSCPARVQHVVVINCSAGNLSPWYHRFQCFSLLAVLTQTLLTTMLSLIPHYRKMEKSHGHWLETVVLSWTSRHYDCDVVNAWSQLRLQCHTSLINSLRQLYACARFCCPSLADVPVSVIVANQDRLVNPKCSEQLAVFYQTHIHKIDDCGHDASLDQPQLLLQLLLQLLPEIVEA